MKLLFWSLRKTQIQDHEGFLSGATVAVMSIKEMDGLEWSRFVAQGVSHSVLNL